MFKPSVAALCLVVASLGLALPVPSAVAQEPKPANPSRPSLPLTSATALSYHQAAVAWSIIHERARIEAEGRLYRTEFNRAIGHSPARPAMNSSFMSTGRPIYYIPARGQFVNAGLTRSWYW